MRLSDDCRAGLVASERLTHTPRKKSAGLGGPLSDDHVERLVFLNLRSAFMPDRFPEHAH